MPLPAPSERTKKRKRRKAVRGSREFFDGGGAGKHHCAVCGGLLHGVPHGRVAVEVRRLSKSKRRPSVPFGGVLCVKCRRDVVVERALVESGLKKLGGVDLRLRKFVGVAE